MTPTEKKYTQHIGKLYWNAQRVYNHTKGDYDAVYDIVMPVGIYRRYGKGRYQMSLEVIQFGDMPDNQPRGAYQAREEYDIEAGYFLQLLGRINDWHQGYFPVVTGELEKDVDQIKKEG